MTNMRILPNSRALIHLSVHMRVWYLSHGEQRRLSRFFRVPTTYALVEKNEYLNYAILHVSKGLHEASGSSLLMYEHLYA